MIYALIFALALTVIGNLILIYRLNKDNSLERQLLLDRIQAGTLQEYKLFNDQPEPKVKEEKIYHDYV